MTEVAPLGEVKIEGSPCRVMLDLETHNVLLVPEKALPLSASLILGDTEYPLVPHEKISVAVYRLKRPIRRYAAGEERVLVQQETVDGWEVDDCGPYQWEEGRHGERRIVSSTGRTLIMSTDPIEVPRPLRMRFE